MAQQTTPLLLTVDECAEALKCSTATVYNKVASGEWPHTRPFGGRNIRFTQAQIEQIIASAAVEPVQRTPRRRKAS